MLDIPKSCIVNKIIPKAKFYDYSIQNDYVSEINWKYKLSKETLNISQNS